MKAVIYARYSCDNQREESIEGQLRECEAYCQKNDFTVVGTYIDRAESARTDQRPEFQHMIQDSSRGQFDLVIVWKIWTASRVTVTTAPITRAASKRKTSRCSPPPRISRAGRRAS